MKALFKAAYPYQNEEAGFRIDRRGETSFKVFFVVAPDGLCYCLGERLG
jgi:hypothetical protein